MNRRLMNLISRLEGLKTPLVGITRIQGMAAGSPELMSTRK